MLFGGLQKNSFIDYPGKISCVLFLSGCNFKCPYCHNPDLARGCAECPAALYGDGLYRFLERQKYFLDGVVISGGEPTLHKELFSLCKRIKEMGFPVKLDTNGSRPGVLERLIEDGLVDYIAMDIKTDPLDYGSLAGNDVTGIDILTSIRTIMEKAPDYEFRTTCVKPFIDASVIERIAQHIEGAKLYALQPFQKKEVLDPEFFQGGAPRQFSKENLLSFREIASPWVLKCLVR